MVAGQQSDATVREADRYQKDRGGEQFRNYHDQRNRDQKKDAAGQERWPAYRPSSPATGVVTWSAIPDGLAEVDIVLIGQHARGTTGGTAQDRTTQNVAAGHSTGRGPDAGTDAGTAEAAVELAIAASCQRQQRDQRI
jgi:hypothetical protein